jgi:uracil-DNA glycosylase family 4
MADIDTLLDRIEAEARTAEFPIDREVYEKAGKDPLRPVLCAGSPDARICSFGRDPGRDEIIWGQPQIGAAGKLVRSGILVAAGEPTDPSDRRLERALRHVFLTNTVPYKPVGNKAYPDRVKERFRPFVEELLACYWQGDVVITLGTEAFTWFSGYAEPGAAATFWKREDKYEAEFSCLLTAGSRENPIQKPLTICPLPHPSPLNQRWVGLFPDLLSRRLKKWL